MIGLDMSHLSEIPQPALRFVSRVAQCGDSEELWHLLCVRMKDYGFDRLTYAITHLFDSGLADPSSWVVLHTHDEGYARRLFGGGGMLHGTRIAEWAFTESGALPWSRSDELPSGDPTAEFRLRELDRAYRVCSGVTISFPPLPRRTKGVLWLTAKPSLDQQRIDRMWYERAAEIEAQLHVFHLRFLSLPFGPYKLTARQRQVLELVACGHTTHHMAEELDLTPATIDKHLKLARETLEVATTAQAVLKASLFNQIFS